MRLGRIALLTAATLFMASVLVVIQVRASDHADPVDVLRNKAPEGGITDLFVYPDATGTRLIMILCVRPALTRPEALNLSDFEYTIHMDLKSAVSYDEKDDKDKELVYRYGGKVVNPNELQETASIKFHPLQMMEKQQNGMDKVVVKFRDTPEFAGLDIKGPIQVWGGMPSQAEKLDAKLEATGDRNFDPARVNVWSGVSDDPFIFPAFFGTNVVAMVTSIPMDAFNRGGAAPQQDWIVWGTSSRNGTQLDHVGRSLRTQNPRFDLLNTLPPKDHVKAITDEHVNPSLMRNIFLRLGFNGMFAYRSWDFVPDVLFFTTRTGIDFGNGKGLSDGKASFPNGRVLEDDVAELLSVYGDTVLKEASYLIPPCTNTAIPACKGSQFPRAHANDKPFLTVFPFLADPWEGPGLRVVAPPPTLSDANKLKLMAIALGVVALWLFSAWLLALYIDHRRQSRRYL